MKKLGCMVALLGVVILVGSIVVFYKVVKKAMDANVALRIPMKVNEEISTKGLKVNTDKACMIGFDVTLTTTKIEEKKEFDKVKLEPQYFFPVSYKVTDDAGKVLAEEQTTVASSDKTKVTLGSSVNNNTATLTARRNYAKFDVPAPGKIRVVAEVKPDHKFGAIAQKIDLKVYDNVSRHGKAVGEGIAMLFIGPVVIVIGLGIFVIGLMKGKKPRPRQEVLPPPA